MLKNVCMGVSCKRAEPENNLQLQLPKLDDFTREVLSMPVASKSLTYLAGRRSFSEEQGLPVSKLQHYPLPRYRSG